jgi:hypothetical protein
MGAFGVYRLIPLLFRGPESVYSRIYQSDGIEIFTVQTDAKGSEGHEIEKTMGSDLDN